MISPFINLQKIRAFLALFFLAYLITSCELNKAHATTLPMYQKSATGVLPTPTPVNQNLISAMQYITADGNTGVASYSSGLPPVVSGTGALRDINYLPSVSPTVTNPEGFVPKVVNGAAVLESTMTLGVKPPAGVPLAGSVAAPATIIRQVPLGSGTGSMAAAMGKSALGVVGGVAAVFAAPEVVGVLLAAQVGMMGYDFYQSLKAQGVSLAADGSVAYSQPYQSLGAACAPYAFCTDANPAGFVPWNFSLACPTLGASVPIGMGLGASPSGYICNYPSVPVASPAPATQDQLAIAVAAAVATAAAAKDIADLYLNKLQLPLPTSMPVNNVPPYTFQSPYAVTGNVVDAAGNVTTTREKNTVTATVPATTDQPIRYDQQLVKETVINNSTTATTTTTTYVPPAVVAAPVTSGGVNVPARDLCVDHPDILACNVDVVGDVASQPLQTKNVNVSLTPVVMAENLICPAPITFYDPSLHAVQVWDIWSKPCSFAPMMKPIILAFAWLTAGLIVFSGRPYA